MFFLTSHQESTFTLSLKKKSSSSSRSNILIEENEDESPVKHVQFNKRDFVVLVQHEKIQYFWYSDSKIAALYFERVSEQNVIIYCWFNENISLNKDYWVKLIFEELIFKIHNWFSECLFKYNSDLERKPNRVLEQ